jgi:hypothetical protein
MKLIMQYLFLPLTIFSLFSTCKKGQASQGEVVTQQDFMNVSYGAHASQKMDVYLPAGRATDKTKAIVVEIRQTLMLQLQQFIASYLAMQFSILIIGLQIL